MQLIEMPLCGFLLCFKANKHLNGMQAAFPAKERRLEALILCEKEVFMYLDENLKLKPQSMSDKVTPADELEEMHQRVSIC